MGNPVSSDLVCKWLTAWSLSRALPLPKPFLSGFKVTVGAEKQKARYVFPELNNDFFALSTSITEPWVYLKVCAPPGEIENQLPEKWTLQPQGYMMSCFNGMHVPNMRMHQDYTLAYDHDPSTFVVRIVAKSGAVAAAGRVVLVGDLAVYDRILTEPQHRRRGLATMLLQELQKIAVAKGIYKNFLVATEEGQLLYRSLGWELYSLYTSVVIPG